MESVALVAPVTALEFAGDVLLAGTGPEVAAFLLSGGAAAGRRSVLREASVRGLRAEPGGRVAAWAARPGSALGPAALLVSGPGGIVLWMDVTCGPGAVPAGGLLLCGDRRGSLLLFSCSGSSDSADGGTLCRVTSVTCRGDYIYSTGRDGCYRQLRLRDQQLEVLQKHRPCKGLQWIEELRFTPDGDLLLLGFHADNFVVWSTRNGRGDVMLYHREAEPCEQQVPGCHAVNVFVTGSEDTTIECYRLQCAVDLEAEGMVSCQVAHMASHWLDEHWDRMKNRHKLVKMDPETRYMSLSVVCGTTGEQLPVPCTFLAAACSDGSVRLFVLLEAAQKLLLVAESFHHQRCVLKVEAFLHTHTEGKSAATDGSIVFWDITSTIADATDALQHSEGELQPLALGTPLLTVMAHSCGVNSLHIQELPEGRFLVASGSDDGSIHVCLLEVAQSSDDAEPGTCLHIKEHVARPCCHAAHVTGIRVLRPDLVLSASVDQRLTLWRLSWDSLEELSTTFFHVPDLAELDCWEVVEAGGEQRWYCVLCGQGLELMRCAALDTHAKLPSQGTVQ
ncbi:hypothetical protein ASZ78_000651 [Callipepla squamata]|uniref:tRNA (34-2'-O)-methyltransferase regulator WDR6 n=1 Tax=Callipepla squamata TaxID=9009 RepID=A0A226NF72_CALSU|nr:hypothetical protein ASZ78_000651 [Callipepla squamata]